MIPTVVVERVKVQGGELVLARHGNDFAMRFAHVELMSSRDPSSERELGRATAARLGKLAKPHVLIGGLGFGYTLRAALDALPPDARVDVVELVPEVVRWNRTTVAALAGRPLDDPRVTVIEDDVANVIRASTRRFEAIVLDVDNGPDPIYDRNAALYRRAGLAAARAALVPGGWLAVWSSFRSQTFTSWLRGLGFAVELVTLRSKHGGGPTHHVWFAQRVDTPPAAPRRRKHPATR